MTDGWAWRQIAATLGLLLVVGIVAGLGVVYSGVYNVAADKEIGALKKWILHTTMENSVEARLDEVPDPPDLDDRELLAMGAEHYDAMCADCHGAPGVDPGDIAEGLHPQPPNLVEEGPEEDLEELFWVTKHGIEMTGMPAWGPTHDDRALWGVVGVMKRFDDMTEKEYRALIEEAAAGHHHGDGGHGDEAGGHADDGPSADHPEGDAATDPHDAGRSDTGDPRESDESDHSGHDH